MSADNRLNFKEEIAEFLTNEVNETNAARLDALSKTHSREMTEIAGSLLFTRVSERYGGALFAYRKKQVQAAVQDAERMQTMSNDKRANRSWLHKASINTLKGTIERLIGVLNYLDR